MKRYLTILLISILTAGTSNAQNKIAKEFEGVCDSLVTLLKERTGVEGKLVLKSVMKRGTTLDFHFSETLGDFPWHNSDEKWFRKTLKSLYPEKYKKYKLGNIYSRKVPLAELSTPVLTFDGSYIKTSMTSDRHAEHSTLVKEIGAQIFDKGLSGRHIALWQSHGRYYEKERNRWEWQRPCLFQTCEDMFTQGFVLPYLVPMLENAGAYVMLPRERDTQKNEIIADNDPSAGGRGEATYLETGSWEIGGIGFADLKEFYEGVENPFSQGSFRMAATTSDSKPTATATWTPTIPERGEYAVYVSYGSLPDSSPSAHYTVQHLGGKSEFIVNQRMGGGTWIYLGTFEFEKGTQGYVMLDNATVNGEKRKSNSVITADAVKIGGGMGNIVRYNEVEAKESTGYAIQKISSGMPRFAEAARYWLQWAGADSTVYYQNKGISDYRDDFMCRGDWVDWISRGSAMNPDKEAGLKIPIDLSLGFHSDAGVAQADTTIGTLTIYTYKSDGKTDLPGGESRMTSRMYADLVQSQVVNDIRLQFDSLWTKRSIWDRAYRESRTPSCPAMILETLSHQNFNDMKYGLDPSFRFVVSRAVYKGVLKYLSYRFGIDYVVQPLPVQHMGVKFSNKGKALISWKATEDPIEPTAKAKGFVLYTRKGDGGFDKGQVVQNVKKDGDFYHAEVECAPGVVMSYRIAAYNDGGIGFPSEIVSIGKPSSWTSGKEVVVINNFDRISAPAYIDTPTYAGFDNRLDSGVAYGKDMTFIGQMYDFRRDRGWTTNDRPGFGASYDDMAGEIIAGNTFDYPAVHGKAILEAGYAFYSCSNERFAEDSLFCSSAWAADIICGKQVTWADGKYSIFPTDLQNRIKAFTSKGGHILISGSYIGTDLWDEIYPVSAGVDRTASQAFAKEVLGYELVTRQASNRGYVVDADDNQEMKYWNYQNSSSYCIESPDGIKPASVNGSIIYTYPGSNIPAGVAHQGQGYKCISLGFPIETLVEKEDIAKVISNSLEYFEK